MVLPAIPAPRPSSEQPEPVPFRLPWSRERTTCRPVIGDTLLLQYAMQNRSIRCVTELTVRQAREMLTAWASEWQAVDGKRDEVILAAVEAGLTKSEVHRLTGIARTTVDRIVDRASSGEEGGTP